MINFLSSWIKNLSLALIIVSILEMILPNSKTKKYVKMVMGLYILFSIISPFIDKDNFNIENIDVSYFEEKVGQVSTTYEIDQSSMDARLKQLYEEQLEKDMMQKLKDKGYELDSCKVTANISSGDSGIEKIVIRVNDKISNTGKEEDGDNDENKVTIEDVLVKEIQKVKIGDNNNQESDENGININSTITKTDINIIKKFLMDEYGVSENCLKIS